MFLSFNHHKLIYSIFLKLTSLMFVAVYLCMHVWTVRVCVCVCGRACLRVYSLLDFFFFRICRSRVVFLKSIISLHLSPSYPLTVDAVSFVLLSWRQFFFNLLFFRGHRELFVLPRKIEQKHLVFVITMRCLDRTMISCFFPTSMPALSKYGSSGAKYNLRGLDISL